MKRNLSFMVIMDAVIAAAVTTVSFLCLGKAFGWGTVPHLVWSTLCVGIWLRESEQKHKWHTENFLRRCDWGIEFGSVGVLLVLATFLWCAVNVPTTRAILGIFAALFIHTLWLWLWWVIARDNNKV